MPSLFELDELIVRAVSGMSYGTGGREYVVCDGEGPEVGSVSPWVSGPHSVLRRLLTPRQLPYAALFEVRDGAGNVLCKVRVRPRLTFRLRQRAEISFADGRPLATVVAAFGRIGHQATNPDGAIIATLSRDDVAFLAVVGPDGRPCGTVCTDIVTFAGVRSGQVQPHTYRLRMEPGTPLLVRIATLGAVILYDSGRR